VVIRSYRVVHDDDIVPRVPKIGYKHVYGLEHIGHDGQLLGTTRSLWLKAKEFFKIVADDLDGGALKDHFLAGYIEAIGAGISGKS
jgi:hypothetical protein